MTLFPRNIRTINNLPKNNLLFIQKREFPGNFKAVYFQHQTRTETQEKLPVHVLAHVAVQDTKNGKIFAILTTEKKDFYTSTQIANTTFKNKDEPQYLSHLEKPKILNSECENIKPSVKSLEKLQPFLDKNEKEIQKVAEIQENKPTQTVMHRDTLPYTKIDEK